jgi:hypothetical protein
MIISRETRGKFLERHKSLRLPSLQEPFLRKGVRHMTIAIGMLCGHGAVIAADTKMVHGDGTTHTARKVRIERSANGAFVVAFAAADVNAVRTLLDDIFEELLAIDPATLREVEDVVRPQMAKWAAAYTHNLPEIELILAASVRAPWAPERHLRGGIGLYFCQPPNTMLLKHYPPDPSTYIGIGGGASVTDPIFKTLFGSMANPRACLKQVAYMMYRAKIDHGQFCGGATNAVFIQEGGAAVLEILPVYMHIAEGYGNLFDSVLNTASMGLLSPSLESALKFRDLVGSYLETMDGYRSIRFLNQFRQEIGDEGIITLSDSQTSEDQP